MSAECVLIHNSWFMTVCMQILGVAEAEEEEGEAGEVMGEAAEVADTELCLFQPQNI